MKEILPALLNALLPLFLALVSYAAAKVAEYIKAKTKNEMLAGVLVRLDDAVATAVKELAQVSVNAAKDASEDGKLPAEVARAAKDAALANIKTHLGSKGFAELMKVLGIGQAEADALVSSKIEAAVHDLKAATNP